jgi:hypothetical protein
MQFLGMEYLISDKGVSVSERLKKFRQYAPTPLSDINKYYKKIIRKKLRSALGGMGKRVRTGEERRIIPDNIRHGKPYRLEKS